MASTYPKFILTGGLTPEQKAFFNAHGFIHFRRFIEPETVEMLIKASIEVQQKWVADDVKKVNGVPIKYGQDLNGATIVQRFAFINQHHPILSEFLKDPRFNALLELAGPGSRIAEKEKDGMVFNHYVNGPESKFTKMGWHVDGLRDIFYGGRLNPMLNVGIHLNNLRPENGGLRIIPGTHTQNMYQMLFRKKHFLDHDEDPNELAIVPEAGDLTIHDGRLWHRVAKSNIIGEESRRRVIYIPIVAGKYEPKDETSPTPFYHKLSRIVK
jgi:ectoine hydroxylase-related dioxygenase (phytanoyl-CoA dioxygenase family)